MPDTPARLNIRSPHDVVALVPYLLGYQPADGSLVAVGLRTERVHVAARVDLAEPALADAAADAIVRALARSHCTAAIVVGYGAEPAVTPAITAILTRTDGIDIRGALRVTDGYLHSYLAHHRQPDGGTRIDPASALALEAIAAGMVAFPDRDAIAQRIAPVTGDLRARVVAATTTELAALATVLDAAPDPRAALVDLGLTAVDRLYQTAAAGRAVDDTDIARLGVLMLADPRVRDHAWECIDGTRAHVDLWIDITRRIEHGYLAPAATLLGFAAWQAGDGVLARIATGHALAADSNYTMAHLLIELLDHGMDPAHLRQWIADQP